VSSPLVHAGRAAWALLLAVTVPLLAASCQSIAGIEERELGPCGHFCDVVMKNCTGDSKVYDTRAKCMGFCKLLEPGDTIEPEGTPTVACRLREAELAGTASSEDVPEHCRSAGAEGVNCGGTCTNYCTVYERACDEVQCGSLDTCIAKCAGLRDHRAFDLIRDYGGNSLQCRLVHLMSATIDPGTHCSHANLTTPNKCDDLPATSMGQGGETSAASPYNKADGPECEDYCRTATVACSDPQFRQYESKEQCLALCPHFPIGKIADVSPDTLGCRLYHSYNSLCEPGKHCPHAGPGGEGHCGDLMTGKCTAYCGLAKSVCGDAFENEFGAGEDGDAACAEDCAELEDAPSAETGDTRYFIPKGSNPGTLACRFLAVSRAAEDPSLCANRSVFGGGDCTEP
jgi:hypothetical protein